LRLTVLWQTGHAAERPEARSFAVAVFAMSMDFNT
jgi:hypothetical protein